MTTKKPATPAPETATSFTADSIKAFSIDELNNLDERLVADADEILAKPATTDDDLAALGRIAEGVQAISTEHARREAAEIERAERVERLAAEIRGDVEPIAASGSPNPSPGAPSTRQVVVPRPVSSSPRVRARGGTGRITDRSGATIDEATMVASLQRTFELIGRGYEVGRLPVAQIHTGAGLPQLGEDPTRNAALVASATRALTAAGGICSPVPARYEQRVLATAERPVRDGLPSFQADRGGIRFYRPQTFSGVLAAGVSVWTAANDANPSNPATKPIVTFACAADEQVVKVSAVTAAMKVGNFAARFDPERVSSWLELLAVEQASLGEETLLATMVAGSTPTTTGQMLGATRDVLTALDRTAATYRSRHRQSPTAPVTMIAPAWLKTMMRSDLARQLPGDATLAISDAELAAMFSVRNIVPVWSLDYQRFDTVQGNGSVLPWPSLVDVVMFSAGSWLFIDGGVLDLGTIRDQTMVGTNDALVFFESFEHVAFVDGWSTRVRLDVCASGWTSGSVDIAPCVSGS